MLMEEFKRDDDKTECKGGCFYVLVCLIVSFFCVLKAFCCRGRLIPDPLELLDSSFSNNHIL